MYRFDDHQHWHYPHHHPNVVLSPIGRGPAGPKGDPLKYSDMTEAEKNDLASRVGMVDVAANYQVFHHSIGEGNTITTLDPNFGVPASGSIYSVEVNGLDLPSSAYSVGQTGVVSFTPSITGGPLEDEIVIKRLDFITHRDEDDQSEEADLNNVDLGDLK